jgi:3'-5' exoribonuclease
VTAQPTVSPRDWVGQAPFPWPPAASLGDGDSVVACYSVNQVSVGRTRNNDAFLRMQLADCYGVVEARMWDNVGDVADFTRPGAYVGVRGRMERYQDELQLRVEVVAPLRVELDDLVLFLPRSARPAEHMDFELDAIIASVADPPLQRLLRRLLSRDTETGHAFRLAPAAKQNHHAYLGGLIEHTLSVAAVCDMLAAHYGAGVDRDLLIAGVLLHDIGKVREIGARGGFPYTDEGKLLGHILIGLQMVADAAASVPQLHASRLLLLQHLIASHQGRYEWQSPREPRTLEAMILHYADDLDAKLNQAGALIAAVPAGWSAYDRGFGRDFLRHIADDATMGAPAPPADERAGGMPAHSGAADAAGRPAPERGAPRRTAATNPAPPRPPNATPAPPVPPELDSLDLFDDS